MFGHFYEDTILLDKLTKVHNMQRTKSITVFLATAQINFLHRTAVCRQRTLFQERSGGYPWNSKQGWLITLGDNPPGSQKQVKDMLEQTALILKKGIYIMVDPETQGLYSNVFLGMQGISRVETSAEVTKFAHQCPFTFTCLL